MKFISVIFFFSFNLNAQTEIKSVGGSFKYLVPWGDGYLGSLSTSACKFQYFNEAGNLEWVTKQAAFNYNNASICNTESEYAYFVNMPFSKTAVLEKTSKTVLLNLLQVDKSGNIKEKAISYTGILSKVAVDAENMKQCYLGAFNDGILFVGTANDKRYHVLKIDHDFNLTYHGVDFEWDWKSWHEDHISKVKYVLGEEVFSLIQMKRDGSEIVATIKSLDLINFSEIKEVTNTISFSGYDLMAKSRGIRMHYSLSENTFVDYSELIARRDIAYTQLRLGSYAHFAHSKNGLKMYTSYSILKHDSNRDANNEGYLTFDMNHESDAEIEPKNSFEFNNDRKSGLLSFAFDVTREGAFIFLHQTKSQFVLKSSDREDITFDQDLTLAEAYLYYLTGVERSETDNIDVISELEDSYVGLDFDGKKNWFLRNPKMGGRKVLSFSY